MAGRIEIVGPGIHDLRPGDEVFGVGRGAFGEFAVADRSQMAVKPPGLSFEMAAALPVAATTALQGLRDKAGVVPGMNVLINGASGGVGTFAVQIARALGANVSCVCSSPNVELNRSLGAVRVYEYAKEDFTQSGEKYDVIFDTQLNHSLSAYRRVIAKGGLLLIAGAGPGNISRLLRRLLRTVMASKMVGPRTKFFVASINQKDLTTLAEMASAGQIRPVIDRRYPLAEVPGAIRYLSEGHARGKIIIDL